MMRRSIVWMNVLLMAGILLLAVRFQSSWKDFEEENALNRLLQQANEARTLTFEPPGVSDDYLLYPDFLVLPERNLFVESRRPMMEEEEAPATEAPPELAARPTLHGVINLNGERRATLVVFDRRNQAEVRQVREGDQVQGYTVSRISDTDLVLSWRDHSEVIPMSPREPRQAQARQQPSQGPNIIRVGTATAAVETVARSAPEEQEERGVEVAVAGGSQAGGSAQVRQTGAAGGSTQVGGQQMRQGGVGGRLAGPAMSRRQQLPAQGSGMPGTVGIPARPRPNQ